MPSVGIEPRPLTQVSETIPTELTHHLLANLGFLILIWLCSIDFDFSPEVNLYISNVQ